MILRQKLSKKISGYWDYGPKDTFDWKVEYYHKGKDSKGEFVRVGSWKANHWFFVALGKTEKLTLSYAKRYLQASIDKCPDVDCTFEYVEEHSNV